MILRPCQRHLGQVRLAQDRVVEQERRVPAEHEPVDLVAVARDDVLSLDPSEVLDHLRRAEEAAKLRLAGLDGRAFVDLGREADRLDPGGAQHRKPGGRSGCEDELQSAEFHGPSVSSGRDARRARLLSRGLRE